MVIVLASTSTHPTWLGFNNPSFKSQLQSTSSGPKYY